MTELIQKRRDLTESPIPVLCKLPEQTKMYRVGHGHGKRYVWSDGIIRIDAYGLDINQAWKNFEREQGYSPDNKLELKLIEEYWGVRIPENRRALRRPPAPKKCVSCGDTFSYYKMVGDRCQPCHEKHLEALREDARQSMEQDLMQYQDKMAECTTGVCDMLHVHHDRLINDPQRLKTDFLIGQICGEEMRQKYLTKSMGGKIK